MSFYKQIMKTDPKAAYEMYVAQKKSDEDSAKAIAYSALIGGGIVVAIVSHYYGDTASSLCAIVGTIWYVLGYSYCQKRWNVERGFAEYRNALIEYEEEHPNN